ncbi:MULTISPECIES: hypothetical protein [Emticicia]|uniref:hypothetical protein n=1 Tax=Emticicia TaxID=312278 RepID=UPI00209E667E|nr:MULTISPECIES: hypothetical protein [Emticicia]UTA69698.1 hypothetical protein MB380_07785 [Emticicia sp. 21SJ11W-3]
MMIVIPVWLPMAESFAQSTLELPDSVLVKPTEAPRKSVGFALNWDARNSIIKQQRVNIWGVNSGIIFGKKRNQVTVGYYWLNFNSYLRLLDFRRTASRRVNLDYYTKTDLYFFSLMYWKNFIENKRWRVSMPVEVGIGATKNQGTNLFTEIQIWNRKDFFMPVQTGLYAKWKATRWVGISVQAGYRYALVSRNIQNNYNGLYYSLGLGFQPDLFSDIYQWIFVKKTTKAE